VSTTTTTRLVEPGLTRIGHTTKQGWSLVGHVLELPGGGTLVHSPVRQEIDAILAVGTPRLILAPNHFHHLGIPPLVAHAPAAQVFATDVTLPRLRRQQPGLTFHPLSDLEPQLPPGVRVRWLDGAKQGELLVTIPVGPERVWLVADALFHVATPVTGLIGLVLRALGVLGGLRVGQTFRIVVGDRGRAGKALIAAFDEDRPARIHVAHGEPYEVGDGSEFRRVVETRLR
jgi:hypothetical protein